jgi:hypothetical protein
VATTNDFHITIVHRYWKSETKALDFIFLFVIATIGSTHMSASNVAVYYKKKLTFKRNTIFFKDEIFTETFIIYIYIYM